MTTIATIAIIAKGKLKKLTFGGVNVILNINEKPKKLSHLLLLSIQHFLAMIVACITVPIIVNQTLGAKGLISPLPIDATIVSAGIGTIFYVLVTSFKSPVFLSSSFAYISAIMSALTLGLTKNSIGNYCGVPNYLALIIGMAVVGIAYVIVAIIIKFTGTKWLRKLLAPVVIGPVIMTIGISLAGSAILNLTHESIGSYNIWAILVGFITTIITTIASHYGKKTAKMVPFVIGLLSGYILALIITGIGYLTKYDLMKIVDFSSFKEIFSDVKVTSFIKIPDFLLLKENLTSSFHISQIPGILMIFLPVAFVTMSEHIGDHENLSNVVSKDLIKDPGLHKTLIGDGIATTLGGMVSGSANTTYGENVAVIGITKVASIWVIMGAAILSVIVGFLTPITVLINTIPPAVVGGVSILLYGFIASSGFKVLIRENVDLNDNRNIFIISGILVTGIGGLVIKFTNNIKIEPIAVAMLIGIILNLILVERKNNDKTNNIKTKKEVLEENKGKNQCTENKDTNINSEENKNSEN